MDAFKIHLILLISMSLLTLMLYYFIPIYKRGLYCDDKSINFIKEKSLVPTVFLFLLAYAVAAFCFCLKEHFSSKFSVWNIVKSYFPFTFGFILTTFITVVIKTRVGRLRPYFRQFCLPITPQCYDTETNKTLKDVYVENFQCLLTKHTLNEKLESRTSFWSGHASITSYSLFYLVLYMQYNFNGMPTIIRYIFQSVMLVFTLYIAYSRVADHHHFLSDIIAGFVAGNLIAMFTYFYITPHYYTNSLNNNFSSNSKNSEITKCSKSKFPNGKSKTLMQDQSV